jgi:hypothetical protein
MATDPTGETDGIDAKCGEQTAMKSRQDSGGTTKKRNAD